MLEEPGAESPESVTLGRGFVKSFKEESCHTADVVDVCIVLIIC